MSQSVPKYPKCPKVSKSVPKSPKAFQSIPKCPKVSKTVQNCCKVSKKVQKYAYVIYEWSPRQAIVLFAIVILFVCCHALRILLNINELLTLSVVRASIKNGCFGVPFWALIGVAVSHFLITVNSSVNFFIYCFMSPTFRRIFIVYLKKVKYILNY